MNASSFRTLFTKLCVAAEAPVPYLEPDARGHTLVAVTLDGIEVVLAHEPERDSRDALLSVAFGPLPDEHKLQAYQALMEMNSLLLWNRACSFGRNREGAIVLQYALPLDSSAFELYECIATLATVARAWLNTQSMAGAQTSHIAPLIAAFACA